MKSQFQTREGINNYIQKGRVSGGAYFKDGIRKVHYVIVVTLPAVHTNFELLSELIRNLEDLGLEFEQDLGIVVPGVFLKIHIDDMVAKHYLHTFQYLQEFLSSYNYADKKQSLFNTPLHYKNVFKGLKFEQLTLMKVKVIHRMLQTVKYANLRGISKLKQIGIVQDYYPLHDGKIQIAYWHNDELLNDRTLLAKYWADIRGWYKKLPLDLIHKYFGAEIAFHFAWCDFYNKMLAPIAIVGTILTIWSIINISHFESDVAGDVCNSTIIACGLCKKDYGCEMIELNSLCLDYIMLNILEFPPLCVFALLVSAWSMFFTRIWKRNEYNLRIRWNLLFKLTTEYVVRFEFIERSNVSHIALKTIYSFPWWKQLARGILSVIVYLSFALLIVLFIYLKQTLYLFFKSYLLSRGIQFNSGLIITETHQLIQALFTIFYSKFVKTMSTLVTNIYCPKTFLGYDRIFLMVNFMLHFLNIVYPLIHTAFIKNLNYNVPKESGVALFQNDSCDPYSCLEFLFVQLLFFMATEIVVDKILLIVANAIKKNMMPQFQQLKRRAMPQYEEEYDLRSSERNTIDAYFSQMSIQFFVVLAFVYAFPLGPICALIHNILHLRMQAYKLVYQSRRPALTRKMKGIGPWNGIIQQLSVFAALCNVLITGFIGDSINEFLYVFRPSITNTYIRRVFSEFRPYQVFGENKDKSNLPNSCVYRGSYYPPDHRLEYHKTKEYYIITAVKLAMVCGFEQILLIIMMTLQSLIPSISNRAKKLQYTDRTNLKNKYNKEFNKQLELNLEEVDDDDVLRIK